MSLIDQQITSSNKMIVMVVADGLGGLPQQPDGKTELETAATPNLDCLATDGSLGLLDPIGHGITPGSGPAHLALFGYDPVETVVGRGLLSALGSDFDLHMNDICARGNFCTLDDDGTITDRRAERIPTAESAPICEMLEREIELDSGIELFVKPEADHRFLLVFRGEHLSDNLDDTDPQKTGVPVLKCRPLTENAARTARLVDDFTRKAQYLLRSQPKAKGVLLRGFASRLPVPTFADRYSLRSAALADYPMYRGLAKLVGMETISRDKELKNRFQAVCDNRDKFDFFYVHFKKTDATGEDGNFEGKVKAIEELDAAIPTLMEAKPDVLIVTGDHSTPAAMAAHSWHPVPLLIHGANVRTDAATSFGETAAINGGMGRFPMKDLMAYALAHAERLQKFGA